MIQSATRLRFKTRQQKWNAQSLRSFATDQNPRIQVLQTEMATLRDQVRNIEGAGSNEGIQVSASRLPAAALDYVRKLRDVKYHETVLELLAKQYEAAYIDEAKSAPLIQVVDRAVIPDKRSWPPRALFIGAVAIASLFLASIIVLTQNYLRSSRYLARQ